MAKTIKLAIFASGNGSNAENIHDFFKEDDNVVIDSVYCNKESAFVFERAKNMNIPGFYISNSDFRNGEKIIAELKNRDIDIIILAGFLLKIPQNIIDAFPKGIINIHPALLPNYGGKGMYGDNVHKAVKHANEKFSGVTIHLVNNKYDEGEHIAQHKCEIASTDTYEDIADKVHKLEYEYFPIAIKDYIVGL